MHLIGDTVLCVGEANADLVMYTGGGHSGKQAADTLLHTGSLKDDFRDQVFCSPGGTVCTTSSALARLGIKTRFLGSVGNDYFGRMAIGHLKDNGVDVTHAVIKDTPTLQVFCLIDDSGDRDFRLFPSRGSAAVQLTAQDILEEIFDGVGLVYLTGVQLMEDPMSHTVLTLIEQCEKRGILVAFDCNLRLNNFGWNDKYQQMFEWVLQKSTVIFGSGKEELMVLTGKSSPRAAAESLLCPGKVVIAKSGSQGALAVTPEQGVTMGSFHVDVADAVGAGDNFNAGFLYAFTRGETLSRCLVCGSAAAAFSLQGSGASHGPTQQQLETFLNRHKTEAEPERLY